MTACQKHSFDFIQGVPLTTSASKESTSIKWESISEVSENLESDVIKAQINNKKKLDLKSVLQTVAEFTKFKKEETKDFTENRSSAMSTALTESSQNSYFRFSLRSMGCTGSGIFDIGSESFIRKDSGPATRQSNSEV